MGVVYLHLPRDPSAQSGSDSLPGDHQQNRGEEARLAQQLEEVGVQVICYTEKLLVSILQLHIAVVYIEGDLFFSKVRQGIHRLLSETDSGDQTEEGGGETEEGEQETERRVVGGYTADGEEVEEEEEESGSIDLEQAEDPVSETAMGCVSREVEEGGGGGGTDSGIDRTTVGSSRVGSAEGWLARLSSRLVMSNAQSSLLAECGGRP